MKIASRLLPMVLLLGGCEQAAVEREEPAEAAVNDVAKVPKPAAAQPAAGEWGLVSSGEGDGLFYPAEGERQVHLFCESGTGTLLVNLPEAAPIGSEERMSLGSGEDVVALVADPAGDTMRGGVSGSGPVPERLGAMLEDGLAVQYGAASVGPLPSVDGESAAAFVRGCAD